MNLFYAVLCVLSNQKYDARQQGLVSHLIKDTEYPGYRGVKYLITMFMNTILWRCDSIISSRGIYPGDVCKTAQQWVNEDQREDKESCKSGIN